MSDPFLILHKVRGEPAFDIAEQMTCPECRGEHVAFQCYECSEGFWWIIPTSGHRAHPIWYQQLGDFVDYNQHLGVIYFGECDRSNVSSLDSIPDHYPSRSAPSISIQSVIAALAPKEPVERRF